MTKYKVVNPIENDTGYGIIITKERHIRDISPDYFAVKRLAEECERGLVEMEYFDDILDSYLSDYATF